MYGMACCDADPLGARVALRRGLAIAQESGNRYTVSHLANVLCRLEARHGDPLASLEPLALAIRNYQTRQHDHCPQYHLPPSLPSWIGLGATNPPPPSPGTHSIPLPEPGSPKSTPRLKTYLRDVLGDQTYESLARNGERMTTAEMATYAYDQIDQARTELDRS